VEMGFHRLACFHSVSDLECLQYRLVLFEGYGMTPGRSKHPTRPFEPEASAFDGRLDPRESRRVEENVVKLEVELVEARPIVRLDGRPLVADVPAESRK